MATTEPISQATRAKLMALMLHNNWTTDQTAKFSALPPHEGGVGRSVSQSTIARWVESMRKNGQLDQLPAHLRTKKERDSGDATRTVRVYPIYGKVQAGMWNGSGQAPHDDAEQGTFYTSREIKKVDGVEPYALKVDGESMTDNDGGRTFPSGSLVLVKPGCGALRPGDFVVAFDLTTQETTFKRYGVEDGRPRLYPLNPAYPALDVNENHTIAGIVVEAMRPLYSRP